MISPIELGSGKRLFGERTPSGRMTVVAHQVSRGGNIIATYEPAGSVEHGSLGPPSTSEREQARQQQMKLEDRKA